MTVVQVFDPPMCCSTGVCGSSVDPKLVRFAADVDWLHSQGVAVERFNLSQQPGAFAADNAMRSALEKTGESALPLVKVDGEVKSSGVYPSRDDLAAWTGFEAPTPSIFSDAVAEAYHREVLRKAGSSPEAVQRLLPRLRDPAYTQVLLVTLPEATPIHEAMQLERDLARADIAPFAWIVNQSLTPLDVTDPLLRSRRAHEQRHLREIADHASRTVLEPWMDEQDAMESTTSRERDLSAVW